MLEFEGPLEQTLNLRKVLECGGVELHPGRCAAVDLKVPKLCSGVLEDRDDFASDLRIVGSVGQLRTGGGECAGAPLHAGMFSPQCPCDS